MFREGTKDGQRGNIYFLTLTAPSFGSPHHNRVERDGKAVPCHANPKVEKCIHGSSLVCGKIHDQKDDDLGSPLCTQCFDYENAVLWNACSAKLWHVTIIQIRRAIAKKLNLTEAKFRKFVKVEYVKVAEMQARCLVHFHVLLRVDLIADNPEIEKALSDTTLISNAILSGVKDSRFNPKLSDFKSGYKVEFAWGDQIKVRPVDSDELPKLARYLSKYVTKSIADSYGMPRRISNIATVLSSSAPAHVKKMIQTAWKLGDEPALKVFKLPKWAHEFGFGGQVVTKSHQFPMSFGELRQNRKDWAIRNRSASTLLPDKEFFKEVKSIVHRGWKFIGDAIIVASLGRKRAQMRRDAREARDYEAMERNGEFGSDESGDVQDE
ncbi:MAG: hypothetical protein M0T78_10895 [Actinomycetota bacterium]|nr:hypothetical protein [Actinomycetota bacterium]